MRPPLVLATAVVLLAGALLAVALAGPKRAPGTAVAEPVAAFVARHWRQPLAPQGEAPASFSPLEASLRPQDCGACHPTQHADWRTSLHAVSMGPGVAGQLVEMLDSDPAAALGCQRCHAPLAEQRPLVGARGRLARNPAFDGDLRMQGLVCAGCHVREHQRFGPPRRDGRLLSAVPRPTLPHNGVTRSPAFLRSEFCRDCHQFTKDGFALNGKLLENTYEEWKASRFAQEGVQCQDCHMPDRRHLWRGIHDEEMVRSGLGISVVTEGDRPTLRVRSTGVGHAFPTYVTPRVVLRAELVGVDGRSVAGSLEEKAIGRDVALDLSRELSDTRLAPGERADLAYRRPVAAGQRVRFSVVVYPDWFYTRFFDALLRQGAGRGEPQIREALAVTRRSPFTLFVQEVAAP
jgi:hypothetical protein